MIIAKVQKEIDRFFRKSGYHKNKSYYKFMKINQFDTGLLEKTEIVVYFFGSIGQTYQINQWIDTFTELNKKYKITVVVRDYRVYTFWKKALSFDIYYAHTIDDLLSFYERYIPKVIIYINNGFKNFQSLIYEDGLHIHINHGESDKSSDHSNQVKAYDYIFVHGPNGYNNYMKYLIKLDPGKLVQTGRPQLDFIKPIELDTFNRKVVIYAPTWEATHRSMRYTSVDVYGKKIIDTILSDEQYYLIYKPHPNLGAYDENVLKIHHTMLKKIEDHKYAITITDQDVNNIYPIVDFAIFDMSSIMTDYLNVDKPFILADVFDPLVHKVEDYNVLKGCNSLTLANIDNLLTIIDNEITNDPMKEKRVEVKELYLGNYKKGESIQEFIESVSNIIVQRDQEVVQKDIGV